MPANLGQAFACAAVCVFVITTVGSSVMWGIDKSAEVDDPYLAAKYGGGGNDRAAAMGNYLTEQCVPGVATPVKDCSDAVALLKARIRFGYHTQRVVVMTETFQSISYLLALGAVWSLRAHCKPAQQVDELEPIAFGCVSLGLIMQVIEMSMTAGPRGYVNDIGMQAMAPLQATDAAASRYSNFQPADWHALYHIDEAINRMFQWFDVTNYGLFAVGFGCLSIVGAERADKIFSSCDCPRIHSKHRSHACCQLNRMKPLTLFLQASGQGWIRNRCRQRDLCAA